MSDGAVRTSDLHALQKIIDEYLEWPTGERLAVAIVDAGWRRPAQPADPRVAEIRARLEAGSGVLHRDAAFYMHAPVYIAYLLSLIGGDQ